jgi:Fe-S-cluster-containing dehydrogenase component
VQLGFVIDQRRCIGCHACTVACKAENDVPLARFRTWVKSVEHGQFPEVRRSFAVLRCNQCSDAPCVTICPVRALHKREDGIVDIDPRRCIGCKACMQGCPYDALYIDDDSGLAAKCHFCAHRVERGLAPACAVVCPTEAIIPGDFDDPDSAVSRTARAYPLVARKPEAGTGPNVLYRQVEPAAIDPLAATSLGLWAWAERLPAGRLEPAAIAAALGEAERRARTSWDADHPAWWGWRVSAYLVTKSLASGLFVVLAWLLWPWTDVLPASWPALAALSLAPLVALAATGALLVADLKRPERFWTLFVHVNWSSWLARGTFVLAGYGAVLAAFALLVTAAEPRLGPLHVALLLAGLPLALLAAAYTGWLFAQSRGRVLWMRRGLALHLIVQAWVAGAAGTLLLGPLARLPAIALDGLRPALGLGLALHLGFVLTENLAAPAGRREEYARAHRLLVRGPWAFRYWVLGVAGGTLLPLALLFGFSTFGLAWSVAAVLALVGLFAIDDALVRAGQALPLS